MGFVGVGVAEGALTVLAAGESKGRESRVRDCCGGMLAEVIHCDGLGSAHCSSVFIRFHPHPTGQQH
eukprot:scaffold11554_cov98-Isochrysis_galbana.AAC.2